jgi:hypothetical protein
MRHRVALACRPLGFGVPGACAGRRKTGRRDADPFYLATYLAVVAMMTMVPVVAMSIPVTTEVQSDVRAVAIAVIVGSIAVVPYASAAMQMPTMTPAPAAMPNLLGQRILAGRVCQAARSVAERCGASCS